jgi:hypothetical protein
MYGHFRVMWQLPFFLYIAALNHVGRASANSFGLRITNLEQKTSRKVLPSYFASFSHCCVETVFSGDQNCAGNSSRGTADGSKCSWCNHSVCSAKNLSVILLLVSHLQNTLLQQLYSMCLLLLRRP